MEAKWTKAELEEWCLGFCRTPLTTLKAFIDAGFCSDQEPSREELRLWPKRSDSTDSTTNAVMLPEAIAAWNTRATAPLIEAIEAAREALEPFAAQAREERFVVSNDYFRALHAFDRLTAALAAHRGEG